MKKRIFLFFKYLLFWYLYFVVCRVLFLLYSFRLTKDLSIPDIFRTFLYGGKMDLSMASYLLILPALAIVFTSYFKGKVLWPIMKVYTFIILMIVSFLVVADLELYRNWGFRMDTTPLMYLKTPKEMIISTNFLVVGCLLIFWGFFYWGSLKIFSKIFAKSVKAFEPSNWGSSLIILILTASLIIPIRGGFGVATMNTGYVYFSKTSVFANHAAINVIWNVGNALATSDEMKPVKFFKEKKAEEIFEKMTHDEGTTKKLLNTARPNIIVIIMESFTSKIIEPLHGLKGITPNFTALCHEGILFDNCYATGDRTDKGVVGVLSGYPALPRFSIINFSKKTENLPFLNEDLEKLGYYSGFVYGCDLNFANFRSYFNNGHYDKIVSRENFDPLLCNSKWGVHDHYAFDRLFQECNKAPKKPFFMAFMSLSSHEPFETPVKTVIPGDDEDHRFLNSAHYADSSLGDFIRKAKTADWWKNTLVIIVADHGVRMPGNTFGYVPLKFHIPLLWLGGAVTSRDTVIHTFCTQTDIPQTILHQLDQDDKKFTFSNNILSTTPPDYSFYVFRDCFGYLKKGAGIVYDSTAGRIVFQEGSIPDHFLDEAKAQMQVITTDFSRR
jgi:phosphoglycerol transferase MdoB-like AlkP superfamily enzyme